MAKKSKFTQRITNAVRALRGDPWPVVFEPILKEVTPLGLETIHVEQSMPLSMLDLAGPETAAAVARRDMLPLIGKALMDAGAVEISKNINMDQETITFRARLRVAMPGEGSHGQNVSH